MQNLIITDFDGTLFDTVQAHCAAYKEALGVWGYQFDEDIYIKLFGMKWSDIAPYLGVRKEHIEPIHKLKNELIINRLDKCIVNDILLKYLTTEMQFGTIITIASNGSREIIDELIKIHGYIDIFSYIGTTIEEGCNKIQLFDKITNMYNIPHSETLIIDDSYQVLNEASTCGYIVKSVEW